MVSNEETRLFAISGDGEKVHCPACQGFGYHEDGSLEGRECEVCDGDGVAFRTRIADQAASSRSSCVALGS
jgi:DnaJ-class molecular chaperone